MMPNEFCQANSHHMVNLVKLHSTQDLIADLTLGHKGVHFVYKIRSMLNPRVSAVLVNVHNLTGAQ